MFDQIAKRYDALNRVLSGGLDRWWRARMIAALKIPSHGHVLDVATGTADVALAVGRAYPHCRVIGIDPSAAMLERGRVKCAAAGQSEQIQLCLGDGQALPFPQHHFDRVAIAFGLRNIPNRMLAIAEMVRVLKPGGKLVILELSEPKAGVLGWLGRLYIHSVMPKIAAWWSGAAAYRYLAQSIAAFPPSDVITNMLIQAGLSHVTATPLTFGAVHLYCGQVVPAKSAQ